MSTNRLPPGPSTYTIAAWLWIRLLGIVYLLAFASLAVQIVGLVGHDGMLPAAEYMTRARAALSGASRFHLLPTLAWLDVSDAFLRGLCIAGAVLAAILAAGIAPVVVLPVLWLMFLSVTVVGRDFLAYQWDALLLEAGLLTAFVAPWTLRHRLGDGYDPPPLGRALCLWLLVRLMFESGAAKLASGDPTWRGLTALSFQFWTQPIPTPLAWYANQLPLWFLKAATAATLAIELAAPLLVIAPRRVRVGGCVLLVGLQAAIALTGNYAFFNLLAAALCVWLLDDATFLAVTRGFRSAGLQPRDKRSASHARVHRWLLVAFAVVTVPVSLFHAAGGAGVGFPTLPLAAGAAEALMPFRSVNAYGLFAVMTTTRPQIIVEGSEDGATWHAYEFKYQPGDVRRGPPWVAPHQPRLDWQLWFAALGEYEDQRWFQAFLGRLLQGAPDVLALIGHDPFGGRPPKYIRAELYQYRFTTATERRQTGAWWTRERVGPYSPVVTLATPSARD